ncbi:MAG: type II toxin-antitoxin system VapC family toxin [Caldilineaceae bacterium]|nr:type II toxin-antitoxin system VapC family toxin [Caldilineaceae bacterium]
MLDTNVISELVAKQPPSKVIDWLDQTDSSLIYLSVITIGEIAKGIERLPDSPRKRGLRSWLTDELLVRFADHIVPVDVAVMLTWGRLTATLEQRGRSLPAIDSLVAAIALQGQFLLVTSNEADFVDTGVMVFNPWR